MLSSDVQYVHATVPSRDVESIPNVPSARSQPLCHVTSARRCISYSHEPVPPCSGVDQTQLMASAMQSMQREHFVALLQLFNEEPALRFPYDLKVRVDDDIQSGFVIRAPGVRGDELKCQVQRFITENPTTWLTEKRTEHLCLKRSKPSVFLDSPDLKKHMRSNYGELQAIISAGPLYILHTGTQEPAIAILRDV